MKRTRYQRKPNRSLDRARLFFMTPKWFLELRTDPDNKGKSDHDLIKMHYSVPCIVQDVRTGAVLNHA